MQIAQKWVSGLVIIALVTTMVLPGRQTPAVINSVFNGLSGNLKAATAT